MNDELLARLRQALEPHRDVVAAYLFGSVARGQAGPLSDVDVAVLLDAPRAARPVTRASLRTDIQEALETAARRPIDLVVLNHASPDLAHRVLRDGVLIVERDRSARIRFEVRSRNEYFDLLPYLKRYREAALR